MRCLGEDKVIYDTDDANFYPKAVNYPNLKTMNPKSLIISTIVFSLVVVIGSYFLVSRGEKPTMKLINYQSSDKEKPKVEVKNNFLDMGQIKISQEKAVEFTVKNIGQKPLQLFNISTSCGCTLATIIIDGRESEEFGMHARSNYVGEITPGKEGKLKVIYRPYVMPVYGPVSREVYVSTNDPQTPKLIFKIKAFVK